MNLSNIKLWLQLLAPYIAMLIFWCWLENAILAIAVYHVQCLCWSWRSFTQFKRFKFKNILLVLPTLLAGIIFYYLIPYMTKMELGQWMLDYKISQTALLWLIPYFGLIHPFIEQAHWDALRQKTWLAHGLFAGYHLIILGSLLDWPWLLACFIVLTGTSILWKHWQKQTGSLWIPALSHIFADLGIIIAAYLFVYNNF